MKFLFRKGKILQTTVQFNKKTDTCSLILGERNILTEDRCQRCIEKRRDFISCFRIGKLLEKLWQDILKWKSIFENSFSMF